MPRLKATTRPVDHARAMRLVIAWLDGDRLAFDVVLEEAMADPVGVPGVLFDTVRLAAHVGDATRPDFRDQLRALLLDAEDGGR